ncbi:MAG: DUF502 domain-containing protein [Lautropia sp.]|nr:DUF502 domain-containing protein [Lautropia sp.]
MLKRYFVTGLVLWVPIGITLWVLSLIVSTMDQSLALLPARWNPRVFIGHDIPGLGAILTLLIIFATGVLTANLVGGRLVGWGERVLSRIPIVRSIYSSVKQVSDTILSPNGNAFSKALLVEYPRKGSWTIAFLTGVPTEDLHEALGQATDDLVSVYVPTTPNPTSGFFLMVRKDETVELDMTVDAALKYIVSMGVVSPVMKDEIRTRTVSRRGSPGESSHA